MSFPTFQPVAMSGRTARVIADVVDGIPCLALGLLGSTAGYGRLGNVLCLEFLYFV